MEEANTGNGSIGRRIVTLAKNSMIYGLGQAMTRFISLLFLPLFTRYLAPDDYGVLSMISIMGIFLAQVFTMGIGMAMGICYFEDNEGYDKDTVTWTSMAVLLVSAVSMVVLVYIFKAQISWILFKTDQYQHLVFIASFNYMGNILIIPSSLRLQFEQLAKTFITLTVITSLLTIGLNVYLVVHRGLGAQGVITGNMLAVVISAVLYFVVSTMKARIGFSWPAAKKLLKLGVPLIPSFGYMFVIMNGNKYMLQWIHGLDETGFYSVGFNVGMAIGVATNGFGLAWTPYFLSYINKQEEATELFGKITSYFVILVGSASLMFFVFSKPVILLMTAPVYHISYPVVGFVACSQFLYGVYCLLLPGVYFNKETWAMNISLGTTCLAYIALNYWLIINYRFMGAAVGITAGYVVLVFAQATWNKIRSKKYLNVKYEPVRLLAYTVLYIAVAGVTLIHRNFSLPVEFLISLGLTAVVVGVCFFLITPDEKAQFTSLVKSIFTQMRNPGPDEVNAATGK